MLVDFSVLFDGFRDKETIFALKQKISADAKKLKEKPYIMEVCGGHTHTIMKYGTNQNPDKKIIYFAIGFETTTPMTAAIMDRGVRTGLTNIYYAINHVTVPKGGGR